MTQPIAPGQQAMAAITAVNKPMEKSRCSRVGGWTAYSRLVRDSLRSVIQSASVARRNGSSMPANWFERYRNSRTLLGHKRRFYTAEGVVLQAIIAARPGLPAARSRRCSGGNCITASWRWAGIVSSLSVGFSAHSHQRSNPSFTIRGPPGCPRRRDGEPCPRQT